MNRFLLVVVVFLLASATNFAQNSGLGFNYQAVVRGADGYVLSLKSVELRFSLMPGQHATQASWIETHSITTDAFGTFGVRVGKGEKAGGEAATFAAVNFAAVYYWLKVEIREGSVWRELSFSALSSVPYAEVANNAEGNETFDRNFEEIRNEMARKFAELVPPGTIVAFGGGTIPRGWMLCDGTDLRREDYPELFAAIGTAWGIGSTFTSTFQVPDLRGVFLRGVSGDSERDEDAESRTEHNNGGNTGNSVGSYQGDAIRNITGVANDIHAEDHSSSSSGALQYGTRDPSLAPADGDEGGFGGPLSFDASRVVPVGSDNRPKNVYVNYIIKY